jgi:uncharacterized membrane protein YphA (DoxX/SURF4 family)
MDRKLNSAFWALKITLGASAFLAGADKFTNLLTDWDKYLSPEVSDRLPIRDRNFMRVVGVIEMLVALGILTRPTRPSAYIASGWLMAIAGNLVSSGNWFDVAVRDVNMAMGAYALARLSEARARQKRSLPEQVGLQPAA